MAEADSQSTTQTLLSVVTGKRPRSVNFTSKSPEVPFLILHDPPGDASSSRMEKGTNLFGGTMRGFISKETGSEVTVNLGPDTEIATGVGVEKTTEIESTNDKILSGSATYKGSFQTSAEICITTNQTIQTNDDEVIVGDDADLYMGAAINFLYGVTDELEFVKDSCKYRLKRTLQTQPGEFATTFIYSEYQIKNVIIPFPEIDRENAAATQWEDILKKNKEEGREI
ncbi:MAG: hypothetical protein IPM98_19325 [Lewinellaceae bacterium]|nr:hypothetical protein [Lewinellaceae bacterium]